MQRWLGTAPRLRPLVAVVSLLALIGLSTPAGEVAPTSEALAKGAVAGRVGVHARGGRSIVHLDANGRPIVPELPADLPSPASGAAAGGPAAAAPLVQPAPGGGEMVVVQGWLEQYTSARLSPAGQVALDCERRGDAGRAPARESHALP